MRCMCSISAHVTVRPAPSWPFRRSNKKQPSQLHQARGKDVNERLADSELLEATHATGLTSTPRALCELCKEERDVLEGEMRDMNEGGMKSFDALDSREKTIAILGDRWWPQTAKQEGDKICKRFSCNV